LLIAATPIGNVADASPRLVSALATADVVAAEDTRRLRRLMSDLAIEARPRVVSFYEGNEVARVPGLVAELLGGARVLLVTDAGMPSVSDPGYRLVAGAVDAGVPVSGLPGPSAVLLALALSGLAVDRFCFEGFLPRKAGERAARLADLSTEPRTMVFFEAPHRIEPTLTAMAEAFGTNRAAALCRELTKTYEEVRRGPLGELAASVADGVKGEITLVVAGRRPAAASQVDAGELARLVDEQIESGQTKRDAIDEVARVSGQPRRTVYDAAHRPSPGPFAGEAVPRDS
jgi:16S rRNA (cytidine1402-2'-O)-methyltransferase